jgi:hypothetical protein
VKRLFSYIPIALGLGVGAFVALNICFFFLVANPYLQVGCGGRTLGSPDPAPPRIAKFRGEVVGKNLSLIQYRWLRRRFKAVGTTLHLFRVLPPTEYQGNVVQHGELVGDVVVDKSGRFDFGDLMPGEYGLSVTYPGQDAVGFGFVIDPAAASTDVLIDASPAYYCNCCGWTFEPR